MFLLAEKLYAICVTGYNVLCNQAYLFWNLYIFFLAFLSFGAALSEMIMLKSSQLLIDSTVYLS